MPPGTPVADIVQAINLEFPGRDAEVVDQAAVLLHKKGTPPRSRAEEVDRFWDQAKAMGNPPQGSESMGRPGIETVLPESSHASSEPTAPSHSAPSTSDTADPTSAAKKSLDALPSEEAAALQRAMKEARAERADAGAQQQSAPNAPAQKSSASRPPSSVASGRPARRRSRVERRPIDLIEINVPPGKRASSWLNLPCLRWYSKIFDPENAVGITLGSRGASAHCPQDLGVHGLRLHKLPSDSESRRDLTRKAILALLGEGASYASIIKQLQLSGRQELAQKVQGIVSAKRITPSRRALQPILNNIGAPCNIECEVEDGRQVRAWLQSSINALESGQVFKAGTRQKVRAVILQRLQLMKKRAA